ncbi:hypothetical protein GGR50DRAFT_670129 [Xylaria sp. CBS 124048]|nr:hypothetical protein GGR50DRAFT_670129 [Xylaria sp. CBS 124048]
MDDTPYSDDDNDSVKDNTVPQAAGQGPVNDKCQFDEWLRDQRQDTYKSLRDSYDAKDHAMLPRCKYTSAEEAAIISSPREYQVELFERAKQKNIIAVLDTGTGKTLIAALLLRHVVEQELDDRKAGHDHRLSFFLVDKVALVHQQYRVLEANLDFNMDSFTGDSSAGIYSREFWNETREKKTVIVCTAEVLHQNLRHSFIQMEQINLLIFDEAHHAKKNHPYARIIKDFYATLEKSIQRRPRILGMTASPVDAKTDVQMAAAQLEGLLHSEIATVHDPTIFSRVNINKPTEGFIEYQNSGIPFETVLWRRLHQLVGKNPAFDRVFAYSRACTTELGRWAADRVWQLWFTKDEAHKIEARTEYSFNQKTLMHPNATLDVEREAIEAVRRAYQSVSDHDFTELRLDQFCLSHKVIRLIEHLKKTFNPETDKCIIFAEQRFTVLLLADIMEQSTLGLQGYRTGTLMGSASNTNGSMGMTLNEQNLVLKRFRSGELNCLFATSAGEEGIDIPDCNAVIRFDLFKTVIQYIQSRGRARHLDSKFHQMVETTNHSHRQLIMEIKDHEEKLREFCNTLPEDRIITGCDYDIEYHLSKERTHRIYRVPSTGATLTYKDSISVLANFASSLPHSVDSFSHAPDYIVHSLGGEFQCEVLLPDSSPIRSAIGHRAPSKQVAKCSAAFEMCLKLRRRKHLDDNMQSAFTKCLPAMRNARLAISSKKRAEYPIKVKPDAWSVLGVPERLFVTVIKLRNPEALGRPSRPLGFLTRGHLPHIATFPLYFGNQQSSHVEFIRLPTAIDCSPEDIDRLNQFTLRIFKDVFSKEYASEIAKMPYFFAPLVLPHGSDFAISGGDTRTIIDWTCTMTIQDDPSYIEWDGRPEQIFDDKFVIDPHDGSRKFYTVRRRPDLQSTDPEPSDFSMPRQMKNTGGDIDSDIWNYSVSLRGKGRAALPRRENLLVVEAEYISLRRNLLDKYDAPDDEGQWRCFLVFETLKISFLPVDIVAMAYNLPAIIYRLESSLIVSEACEMMGFHLQSELALEAMTKDSDNTDEHSETQVNVQRGMGGNYERLEFLGDSFLKMSTTIALFSQIPDSDEYQYHVDRMVLVCNKNLFNNALELKLEASIRTKAFDRRTWYPEGLNLLKGKRPKPPGSHALADKSIADVCEALIGAAYMTGYEQKNLDTAIKVVTKFVNNANHKMTKYSDYYAAYKKPEWQIAAPRAAHCDLANEIEQKMGYKFKYPRLLRSAFTHPSYGSIFEGIPNYQRLEFLGDALLDMTCVDYLFQNFPGADPQWLTEHKMAMVSNQFLGCLCVSLNLQKHMLSMAASLQKEIADYVVVITDARTQAEEAAVASGLGRAAYARNYWISEKRPPKCLPDLVESYVGALFVDSEYDYQQVQRFFNDHVLPYFEDIHLYDTYANSQPVTLLSNILATQFRCMQWSVPCSETDDEDGEFTAKKIVAAVMIHGSVRESAFSDSGRTAKLKAAQKMLHKLKDMSLDAFRTAFDCGCSSHVDKQLETLTLESQGELQSGMAA